MKLLPLALLMFPLMSTAASAADLQAILDQLRDQQDIPGISAAVIQRDAEVFAGGSGFADVAVGRKIDGDTILYAGSLSKIFTAVLTLNLVSEGLVELDQPVPGIGNDLVGPTVTHLLTHSSGLVREGNFGYWFSGDFPDRTTLSRFLQSTEFRTPPGQAVRYSNVGYAALGLYIEDVAGQPFAAMLESRVLEPLAMNASGAPGPTPGLARGYTPPGRMIPSIERPFAGVGAESGDRYLREYHNAEAMTPAFGIYTSATDLGRLARFLLGYGGETVLPDRLRRQMLEPSRARRTLGLGVGTVNGRQVVRHNGWFAAHKSHLLIDLESEVAAVVLTNGDNAEPDLIAEALVSAMIEAGPEPGPAID
jgi:CubicO group peptidase (beta-lactamase class C family)